MNITRLVEECGFTLICDPDSTREVDGVYACDLLSWVMGKAKPDNAWITIMSNMNVIAVASLSDVSCVIFAEGVTPEEAVINTARDRGINLLSSSLPIYETALKLSGVLK